MEQARFELEILLLQLPNSKIMGMVSHLFLIKLLNSVETRKTNIANSDTYYNLHYLIPQDFYNWKLEWHT